MERAEPHIQFIAAGDTITPHTTHHTPHFTLHTHQGGVISMEVPQGKYAWMIKIGEKGQFVIPKEARELFGFQPGTTILVLADEKRGLAIPPVADSQRIMKQIFDALDQEVE